MNPSHQFLPLFPLSLVVYPGEFLRLHIFEPRYQQLIQECVSENRTFGIPSVIDKDIKLVATELRVVSVDRTLSGGEMDITTQGLRRFQIHEFFRVSPNKLYPGGEITWLEEDFTPDVSLQQEIFRLLEEMYQALGINSKKLSTWQEVESYRLGHHVGMTIQQEFELLQLPLEVDRLTYLRDHLLNAVPLVVETERLKAKARLNGHYKNIAPPEF